MKLSGKLSKSIFFTITLIVGGGLFVTIIQKVGIEKIIETISTFHLRYFLILVAINAIPPFISTLRWKIILDTTGNIIPFKKVFAARMIGYSINYLTPSGLILGEPFKAMVLSGKTELRIGAAMASIIIEGSIFLSTLLLFIVIGIFAFLSYANVSFKILIVITVAMLFLLGLFYLFFTKMIKPSSTLNEKGFFTYIIDLLHLHKLSLVSNLKNKIINRENEIKKFFRFHKKPVFDAIFLSILEIGITLISSWLTLYFLGLTVEPKALLGLFSLMSISYLIPLPASLGGMELSQIFAFDFFNLGGQATALAFALITRIVGLIFVSIGIGYLIKFELSAISVKIIAILIKISQKFRGFLKSL